ncbi:hypothetical protein [Duganella violaceipulchra]|uniref:Flagellar basal body-associated protein FliL n=1 Tax=Duganella violaceipulchra TaxID=2849652 RepID=A0AA41L225_9BURK|nr:hypothetical protein [Duganella violaceicalia]MBV6325721.1 hypothetical protein [Duganella violaceicalia]MCP2012847.1 flagellar basal body-associated protein FliL [Duganella violaceicalia]
MSDISSFGATAKGLAKNPIGIIALFIVLIYGFAALTLGFNPKLEFWERVPLVWFLVLFPVAVLALFGWLVSQHHEKLYAPSDFRTDDIFLKKSQISEKREADFQASNEELDRKILEIVNRLSKEQLEPEKIAKQVAKEVKDATTFIVDGRAFLGRPDAVFTYPIAAFETLGALTDEVYFKLSKSVRPFQYGTTWVLRNESTGDVIRTLRMLTATPPGQPLTDIRTLREVGIHPGNTLVVEPPPC